MEIPKRPSFNSGKESSPACSRTPVVILKESFENLGLEKFKLPASTIGFFCFAQRNPHTFIQTRLKRELMINHIGRKILLAILTTAFFFACATDNGPSSKGHGNESSANLPGYQEMIVGTWQDNNSIAAYNADGTRHTKYDNGDESFGTWHIEGDILTDVINEYKKKNGRIMPFNKTYTMRFLYIDENRYNMRYEGDGSVWNATRIKKLE